MNFKVDFTEEQLTFVLNLVAERPFKEVHELIASIRSQAQAQIQAAQQPQELQLPEGAEVTVEEIKK